MNWKVGRTIGVYAKRFVRKQSSFGTTKGRVSCWLANKLHHATCSSGDKLFAKLPFHHDDSLHGLRLEALHFINSEPCSVNLCLRPAELANPNARVERYAFASFGILKLGDLCAFHAQRRQVATVAGRQIGRGQRRRVRLNRTNLRNQLDALDIR